MAWWKKTLIGIGGVLAVLIVAGVSYQKFGASNDAKLAPPQSEMVAVNGRKVHFFCMGQGPRTYLLEAAHASWSFAWWRIQPLLAKTGRACAFDRPGFGWSDWTEGGYDGASAAEQLRDVLKAAHIAGPFIYVGHSLGANFALIYAARHPKSVSALVLLDPADPESILKHFNGTHDDALAAPDCGVSCHLYVLAAHLGITRLMSRGAGTHSLPPGPAEQLQAGLARPGTAYAAAAQMTNFAKTAYETEDVHGIGDVPLLLVLSSSHAGQSNPCRDACVKRMQALSTRSAAPVTIPDATHVSFVGGDQAPLTASAIVTFANRLPAR
jgi:pimeloyl-ACP methyl ester carboxylesterase